MVSITDAKQIIRLATDAIIQVFHDCRWLVPALILYERTRLHVIEFLLEKKYYHKFIQIIKNNGFYEIKMEYTTTNHTVWEDLKKRIIDLHCFEYTKNGEILYEGDCFPSEIFSGIGKIEEIEVSCIEPYSQLLFHLGYDYDENDMHDVKLLCEVFHMELPEEYR